MSCADRDYGISHAQPSAAGLADLYFALATIRAYESGASLVPWPFCSGVRSFSKPDHFLWAGRRLIHCRRETGEWEEERGVQRDDTADIQGKWLHAGMAAVEGESPVDFAPSPLLFFPAVSVGFRWQRKIGVPTVGDKNTLSGPSWVECCGLVQLRPSWSNTR